MLKIQSTKQPCLKEESLAKKIFEIMKLSVFPWGSEIWVIKLTAVIIVSAKTKRYKQARFYCKMIF